MSNDLFEINKLGYNNQVSAQALFFHSGGHYALRVEAPTIGKEFTDSVYIGTDPEGFLFYNDITDLDQPTTYVSSQVTNPIDSKPCSKVDFYFTNDKAAGIYATFLAYDPVSVVSITGMNNHSATGKWVDLNIGQVTGTVTKTSTGTEVTLIVNVIGKKAVIKDPSHLFPTRHAIHSRGTFSFKSIKDINAGTIASYNKDRIVFYRAHATDFVGFFIPFEGSSAEEIKINGLGDVNTEFHNIVWTDI